MLTDLETAEVEITLSSTDTAVIARASLEVPGRRFDAEAAAPTSTRSPDPELTRDLAIARVLRALEADLMHWVHERINRYTGN
jgi:hypothetical protein